MKKEEDKQEVVLKEDSDSKNVSSELTKLTIQDSEAKEGEAQPDESQLNKKYLKIAFEKVLTIFNKNISQEALYANTTLAEGGILSSQDLFAVAQKVGLKAEMRRINILDIKSGPCILIMSKNNNYVFIDENTGFDPKENKETDFDTKVLIQEYIGYAIFFYEEDLSVSSFVKKTSFLFTSISNFKPIFIETIVLSLFINLFAIASPFFTMNVYDRVIPNLAMSTLFVLSFGMILLYIFDFVFKLIKSYLTDYISLNIGNEVDQLLLDKLLLMKSSSLSMSNGAKTALFKELSMVREFYFSRFIPTLIDLPFLVLFIILLLFISPLVAIVPIIASIFIFVINVLLQVPLQNTYHVMMNEEQNRTGMLVEVVSGIEGIKTFNGIGKTLYKWKRVLDKTYRTNFFYNLWVNVAGNASLTIMNIVVIVVMIVGVYEIANKVMTTGGLIASSAIASRIMTTVIGFSGMVVRYRSIQNTLRYLEKIVNSPMEDESEAYGKKGPLKGNITFKNVSFFYPGLKSPILNSCSFAIKAGYKVAIIGKTGAGKSTITRLLLGLDFHNNGEILVDNIDINNIHISELRANIGFMPQKSYFFQGTVRENILMSNAAITEEQYQKACDLAGVKLITALSSKGDDMMIQEQGKNLSGGQQQIIALARAIINDPPIIIMDEPTNGMDTALEATFMENTKRYIKDKTFILITHKPSQLALVDRVILIDNSTVVVDDTKEKVIELLAKGNKNS